MNLAEFYFSIFLIAISIIFARKPDVAYNKGFSSLTRAVLRRNNNALTLTFRGKTSKKWVNYKNEIHPRKYLFRLATQRVAKP